ncbi:unnamed protein product [Candidula unifasciata]|uniref:RING-type domain-containing protein n=1 Tax=Candidula unifasciata TaxID=100452 RepID=A0A8S3YVI5_9EUPU|nr:unnamed protein product [Candidula unifasciata]
MTVEARLMSNEFIRIGTYIGWKSNGKPNIIDLVKAGFYYTGHSDIVRCFSCGVEIEDWQQNSDPFVMHSSNSPGCAAVSDSGSNNRQDYVPSLCEPNQSSSSNAPLSRNETVGQMSVNSLCFRGPWSRSSTVNRTYSSNQYENDSQTASQTSTSYTLEPREDNTNCSPNQTETSSRTHIQRSRSDGAERSLKKDIHTIPHRKTSTSDVHPTELRASEEARFQTYFRWTSISVARAREFARAGFIYVGPADRVQCVFCNGMLHLWKSEDSPVGEHRKHFPQCRYVVEYLSAEKLAVPKHAKYRTEASRLESFQDWDPHKNPKPTSLAKAGFFYTAGVCANGTPTMTPWVEHARWFPNCSYVTQTKGPAFISAVLGSTKFAVIFFFFGDFFSYVIFFLICYKTLFTENTDIRRIMEDKMTAQMDNPVIKAVLRLDIPKKFVKKAIRQRLTDKGQDFTNETALLEAVFGLSKKSGQDLGTTKKLRVPTYGASASSTSKNFLLLAEENQKLKEQKMCKICLDEDACVAFIPCGHLVCSSCAPALALCPICRAKITSTIRTYMS